MAEWRYIAQDARTREFVHMDLPLSVDSMSWTLSGAGQFSGTCAPDTGLLRGADGDLVMRPWGTFLYAESDGVIRWGGIVITSELDPARQAWTVQAAGFATYPNGISFHGSQEWTQVDPMVPFAAIWTDIQTGHGDMGNLDVLVITDSTPERIGYNGTNEDTTRIYWGQISPERWAELVKDEGWRETIDGASSWIDAPARVYRSAVGDAEFQRLLDDERYVAETKPEGAPQGWVPSYADPPTVTIDRAPYVLARYEAPDCGSKLDELTQSTPFDWVERHWWVPETAVVEAENLDPDLTAWMVSRGWYGVPGDGAELLYRPAGFPDRAIAHVIHAYWPRIGGRRTDLAFVQGDNVVEAIAPTVDGDEYANNIVGIGAGQGPTILRHVIGTDDGNLYREHVYSDKSVSDLGILASALRDELAWRGNQFDVSEVTVIDHPNAPIASWQLGDDVFVQAVVPWFGDVNMWCRVTGWEALGVDRARLQLTRSDAFRYGGV